MTNLPPWTCPGCGKQYDDPVDVPPICPECGEYADEEPE
jgi:predicted Zn-ribbon and HTH transcriptional regulator